jgi:hypothetical protein
MITRDSVRLDADVWRPAGGGPYPVLLMRQPYGRAIASTVTYAHPSWYARHGYVVVVQDVRGRGTSDGEFDVFAQEAHDGADAIDWAARLPGATGAVGMYGFSYQGIAQWLAAASRHPALKAIAPAMAAWDIRTDMAYENGAFRLGGMLFWGAQMGAGNAEHAGDAEAQHALTIATRALPVNDPAPAWPKVMERFGRYSHYGDWLDRPDADPRWDRMSPAAHAGAVDLPTLHIGGWFDFMLGGTLAGWRAMQGKSSPQRLVIGPWSHMPWARSVGGVDLGPEADSAIDLLQLRWFDHWLKGVDTGLLREPPVRLFELGGAGWRGFDAWPQPAPECLYLASDGRASVTVASGQMQRAAGEPGEDRIVHDPFRPAPSVGGHCGAPVGPADRSAVDQRTDVLTFSTAPLPHDLRLAGDVSLELFCDADQPCFDLSIALADITPQGRAITLATTHARCAQGADKIALTVRGLCARIARGHALRLSIAAAAFPGYELNPGTGARGRAARLVDQRITTLTIRHGGAAPSRLLLPVVDR